MLNNKIAVLVVVLSVGVIGFILYSLLSAANLVGPKPEVVSVFPAAGALETSRLPEITITFNRQVSPNQISFSSVPVFEYTLLTEKESTTVKYLPKKILEGKTTYEITLKFKSGGGYAWNFTTTESEAGAIPGWSDSFQKEAKTFLEANPPEEVEIRNQIIEQTPYSQTNYSVEYYALDEIFVVHLCQEPFETTKQEAQDWFNSFGAAKLKKLPLKISWLEGCEPPKIIPKSS
ncbi:MAG: Ig-like domain-containing protein [bacterium]|nr:Ig-like domain-containing protein [bacterium]